MSNNWQTVKLGDICEYQKEKISISDIDLEHYISTENLLANRGGKKVATSLPNATSLIKINNGQTVVSNIRPYFKKIWIADSLYGCMNDVLAFNLREDINQKYFYYLLSQDVFFDYVMSGSKGTKMPRGDKSQIMNFEISLPSLPEQERIAGVLSALDDKIENNNAINKKLEEMAQAIFKSYFIDFTPFNGSMPNDWQESDIYSIADIIYGAPFSSKKFNIEGEGKPIIRIRDLKEQKFATFTTENHPKGYLIQHGDILVGMDGEFQPHFWGNDEAWLNQRISVFKNKRPKGKAFLFYSIKPLLNFVEQTEMATTVIHIGKKDYDSFKIFLPNVETLNKFDDITMPIIEQMVFNISENKKLTQLRDSLLPKLMSGEIRA